MSQRISLGKVGDIPEGGNTVIEVNGKDVVVFLVEGRYYAIDDMCPHAGASLSSGRVDEGIVTCPWHYWRFRLDDGAWADNPRVKVGCYPVHVVDDKIELEVPVRTE